MCLFSENYSLEEEKIAPEKAFRNKISKNSFSFLENRFFCWTNLRNIVQSRTIKYACQNS